MSRRRRIIRNIALGLAAFAVTLVLAAIVIVQSSWFEEYAKHKLIATIEDGTGGRAAIGSLSLDWKHMRVTIRDFAIHGREPAGAAPWVAIQRVELDLRLLSSFSHILSLSYLGMDHPEMTVIVFPDGSTNVPTPRQPSSSNETPLQTVVDLAVGRFQLSNGLLTFDSRRQALNVTGENLRAQLTFSAWSQTYKGQISLDPLYVTSRQNPPVRFRVSLPVTLARDRVELTGARISSDLSQVSIDASIKDMRNPAVQAHVTGRLALADLKNCANLKIAPHPRELSALILDADATVDPHAIHVNRLHLALGNSDFEASGDLKDAHGSNSLDFRARLALSELGRLANLEEPPDGLVTLQGAARLDQNDRLSLSDLRLDAFGGEMAGNASLEDFARFQVNGNFRHFDLQAVARAMGSRSFAYSGIASGPFTVQGDLRQTGARGVTANVRIAIAPGRKGIPVSGRVDADYRGAADDLRIADSYVALPHTRLTVNGSIGNRFSVGLTTRNLDDLLAALPAPRRPAVSLAGGGQAVLAGTVEGRLSSPRLVAHLSATHFVMAGRQFNALTLDATAAGNGAAVSNGTLTRGAMQARFAAAVGLRDWQSAPGDALSGAVSIRNGDLADVLALAGQPSPGYTGALAADAKVSGTVGNPIGSLHVLVARGTIQDEPFDQIQAQVNLSDRRITVPQLDASAGAARVSLTAEFEHPRESFTTGRLHAHVQTANVNLAQLRTVQKQLPNSSGELQLQADLTGNVLTDQFDLTTLSADAFARNLHFEGQNYGDCSVRAQTRQQTVHYDVTSDFAGSKISLNGSTELTVDYPTTFDATIGNLPVERILTLAKRADIPAKGTLSATLHFSGPAKKPAGNADFNLTNAVLYGEPIDHVKARITYTPQSMAVSDFEVLSGPSHLALDMKYDHPAGNLQTGDFQFQLKSGRLELARIHNVQRIRPGLAGSLQMAANGAAQVRPGGMRVLLRRLDANVTARGIMAQGQNLGDLTFTSNTAGSRLNFTLDSNLAQASIHGQGGADLNGDYPLQAKLTFGGMKWTRLLPLLTPGSEPPAFEATVDGDATIDGPMTRTNDLSGSLELTRVSVTASARNAAGRPPVTIQNQGPISVTLARGTARLESFHFTGPDMDMQARGAAALNGQSLDLNINANANLALAKRFDRDVISSGTVALAATVGGSVNKPLVNGKLSLHDASLNYAAFPNGISHANGVVQFNGNSAAVQNITGESGGGKINLDGFVAFRDELRFGLRARATGVRVLPQQGMSAVLDANLNLTGTVRASRVSGLVTVQQVTYAPQSDIGAILARSTPPVENAATPSPLLDNMKLDVQVRTAASIDVRASMAENLQLDANLRLRGSASQPGLLGRITITDGQLVFFNSTYTVNTGTISFFNPVRIEPVLNLSLNTQAKGVDVVLKVTGPIDNMKLSYTSNPPLQFQEIVGLLAAGQTPTSDPTILANQPPDPPQSFTQLGESAVVTQALADPVASRLQRVFGISQLSLNPVFSSGTDLPEARIALTQRISSNMTFTYVTALNAPNTQIIRAEWMLNERWAAMATRDQNGILSVRLTYRREIR